MIILLFILCGIGFFLDRTNTPYKKEYFGFLLLCCVFMEGFRFVSGTDYNNYASHYQKFENLQINHYNYEPLYALMVACFRKITPNFHLFNVVYFSVLYLFYYITLPKITSKYLTAFYFFICIIIGYFGSNRQLMAMAISFFAVVFYLKKHKLAFVLWILVAVCFHYSALVVYLFLILEKKIPIKYWLIIIVLVLLMVITTLNYRITALANVFAQLRQHYSAYFTITEIKPLSFHYFVEFSLGTIRRVFPVFLLLFYRKDLQYRKFYNLLLNISLSTLVIYLFSFHNYSILNGRAFLYLLIYEAIIFSWVLSLPSVKYNKPIVAFFVILGAFYMAKGVLNYHEFFFPYQTIFITF